MVPPYEVSEIPATFFEKHPDYQAIEFNAFQTWVEYLNRLTGAVIGLFAFATAILSLGFWRKDKRITVLSIGAMLLTGFEGWLGKLVVDQNLAGGMVTIHMLVAMIILALLITAVYLADAHRKDYPPRVMKVSTGFAVLSISVLVLTLVQILIGTQVREEVDAVAIAMGNADRETWVDQLGFTYSIHKVLWIVVSGLIVVWVQKLLQISKGESRIRIFAFVLLGGLGAEVLLGIILGNFALPALAQPLHLFLASLIFAAEYALAVNVLGIERFLHKKMKLKYYANQQLVNAER
jgi:cytochrome c oxidase assembly protein subunit 15